VLSRAPTLTLAEKKRDVDTLRGFSMIGITRSGGKIIGCKVWSIERRDNQLLSTKAIGVVDIFVSGQASEYRLTELRDQPVTTVAACPP
jgi:hypothetical protein